MSEESDAETCRSNQKEYSFGEYEDKDYGINVETIMIQTMMIEIVKTTIILEKRASLILGLFL